MAKDHATESLCHHGHDHSNGSYLETLKHELTAHFPYAIFAVALSLVLLSILGYGSEAVCSHGHGHAHGHDHAHGLFHTLHFLHILFASTGTVIVYRKFGGSVFGSFFIGSIVPAIFCTLSDAVMPYLGGILCGVPMHFHWCFYSHLSTVLPFLLIGVLNGLLMSFQGSASRERYVATSHFAHIFISAFASTVYMISHGFHDWQSQMAYVFCYLLLAVLIPCTLADVVVPAWFGLVSSERRNRRKGA